MDKIDTAIARIDAEREIVALYDQSVTAVRRRLAELTDDELETLRKVLKHLNGHTTED